MRDDAVLRRALPLGRGLGRMYVWNRISLFFVQIFRLHNFYAYLLANCSNR